MKLCHWYFQIMSNSLKQKKTLSNCLSVDVYHSKVSERCEKCVKKGDLALFTKSSLVFSCITV